MAPSWFQILIVVVLLVLLFGRGKISDLMGDVAKGIKSFKKGIAEDEADASSEDVKTIEHDEAKGSKVTKSSSDARSWAVNCFRVIIFASRKLSKEPDCLVIACPWCSCWPNFNRRESRSPNWKN